jgi:hypothetical protein
MAVVAFIVMLRLFCSAVERRDGAVVEHPRAFLRAEVAHSLLGLVFSVHDSWSQFSFLS